MDELAVIASQDCPLASVSKCVYVPAESARSLGTFTDALSFFPPTEERFNTSYGILLISRNLAVASQLEIRGMVDFSMTAVDDILGAIRLMLMFVLALSGAMDFCETEG